MGEIRRQHAVQIWVEDLTEVPMTVLSVLILVLIGMEFLLPLTPEQRRIVILCEWIIWIIFLLHFMVMFSLASSKTHYLRRNWLLILSLLVPVLRPLLIFRAVNALRLLNTTRLLALTNRAIHLLGQILQARRIIFASVSTLIVVFASSVGIYFLERGAPGSKIQDWGTALWFATRSVMNADIPIAPVTPEGRVLGVLITLYGLAVFGVITASIASWFIQADRRVAERHASATSGETAVQLHDDLTATPATTDQLRERIDHLIILLDQRRREDEAANEGG